MNNMLKKLMIVGAVGMFATICTNHDSTVSVAQAWGNTSSVVTTTEYYINGENVDLDSPFHPESRYMDERYHHTLRVNNAPFQPVPVNSLPNLKLQRLKITASQLQECYDIAKEIVRSCANFSRVDQLKYIAGKLSAFNDAYVSYSVKTPHYGDSWGFFVDHNASCRGAASAVGLCLNILGMEYEHVNLGKWQHQWCRVKIDGQYFICDAYGLYVGPEPAPYKHPYLN